MALRIPLFIAWRSVPKRNLKASAFPDMNRKFFSHRVTSTKQLTGILEKRSGNRNVIFSDLYYGSFQPHHVATEFAWQLNIDITTLWPLSPDSPVSSQPKGLLNFSSFV